MGVSVGACGGCCERGWGRWEGVREKRAKPVDKPVRMGCTDSDDEGGCNGGVDASDDCDESHACPSSCCEEEARSPPTSACMRASMRLHVRASRLYCALKGSE